MPASQGLSTESDCFGGNFKLRVQSFQLLPPPPSPPTQILRPITIMINCGFLPYMYMYPSAHPSIAWQSFHWHGLIASTCNTGLYFTTYFRNNLAAQWQTSPQVQLATSALNRYAMGCIMTTWPWALHYKYGGPLYAHMVQGQRKQSVTFVLNTKSREISKKSTCADTENEHRSTGGYLRTVTVVRA